MKSYELKGILAEAGVKYNELFELKDGWLVSTGRGLIHFTKKGNDYFADFSRVTFPTSNFTTQTPEILIQELSSIKEELNEYMPFEYIEDLPESDKRFAQTEFLVDGDAYEYWEEYVNNTKIKWDQDVGTLIVIGKLGKFPINLSVSWVIINGIRVAFYEIVSSVAYHPFAEKWLKSRCPRLNWRDHHCDSRNYNHLARFIRENSGK
jgi:hypothetical protein